MLLLKLSKSGVRRFAARLFAAAVAPLVGWSLYAHLVMSARQSLFSYFLDRRCRSRVILLAKVVVLWLVSVIQVPTMF